MNEDVIKKTKAAKEREHLFDILIEFNATEKLLTLHYDFFGEKAYSKEGEILEKKIIVYETAEITETTSGETDFYEENKYEFKNLREAIQFIPDAIFKKLKKYEGIDI